MDFDLQKRNLDPKYIDAINKHLADQPERQIYTDEKPTIAEDIKIDVLPDKASAVRDMFQKN